MRIIETKRELHEALAPARREERTIGLVPTMGYLHDGHVALIEAARADCEVVVMSLFVNPAQFGPGEDLERYPRDRDRDAAIAAAAGVDLVATEQPGIGAGGEKGAVNAAAHASRADQRDRGDRGDVRAWELHPFQFPVEIPDGRLAS